MDRLGAVRRLCLTRHGVGGGDLDKLTTYGEVVVRRWADRWCCIPCDRRPRGPKRTGNPGKELGRSGRHHGSEATVLEELLSLAIEYHCSKYEIKYMIVNIVFTHGTTLLRIVCARQSPEPDGKYIEARCETARYPNTKLYIIKTRMLCIPSFVDRTELFPVERDNTRAVVNAYAG